MRHVTTLFAVVLCAFLLAAIATAAPQSELNKNPQFYNPATAYSKAPNWRYGFGVGGFYSSAHQEKYSRPLEDGTGFDFGLIYNVSNRVAIQLFFGKSGLNIKDIDYRIDYELVDKIAPSGVGFKPDDMPWPFNYHLIYDQSQLDLTQYFFSFHVSVVPDRYLNRRLNVYLIAGVGLLHYSIQQRQEILDTETEVVYHYSIERSQNRGGFQFGLGTSYMAYRNIGFDLSVAMIINNKSTIEPDSWNSAAIPEYDSTIDIRLGLIAAF